MPNAFIDLENFSTDQVRHIVTQSGVIWPEGGSQEERFFRFRIRRIVAEAYRRGVQDGQKINAAVAVMFGGEHA